MDDTEHEIRAWLDQALAFDGDAENTLWKHFEGTLPARQGWLSFHIAMEEAGHSLRQAMTWIHYPLSLRGCTKNRSERG